MNTTYQQPQSPMGGSEQSYDLEDGSVQVNKRSYGKPAIFGLISLVCVSAAMLALATTRNDAASVVASSRFAHKLFRNSASVSYNISASHPTYGEPTKILEYLPWDTLIEPYQDQYIELSSLVVDGVDVSDQISGDYTVSWNIDDVEYSGSPATVNVEGTGVRNITVSISYLGNLISVTETPVAVKYIRREIRSLTDSDRTKWVNTMKMLYTTSLEDGQDMYGEDFYNAEWFAYQHLNGAGRNDCDHWHDGAAIATTHLGFTLVAERALQSIDPSISMPYWEYAHDYLLYDQWNESAVFGDDWLGIASPTTSDYSLQTGIWANTSIPDGSAYTEWDISKEGSLNPFVNGYGWLRSPWNNNPAKYISRHGTCYETETTTMPTCALMAACYNSDKLTSMNDCLNGVTHGPVHILIGGCWGEGDTLDGVDELRGIDKLLYFKMLWRMGYTRCPTSCTYGETCSCAIPDEYFHTIGAYEMLESSGIWDVLSSHVHDDTTAGMTAILRGLQDPASVGEMFTSMASFDPSFWPLHGQLDRILSRKRAQAWRGLGGRFDQTWGWSSANSRYTEGICDWSNVKSVDDLTLPNCTMGSDVTCPGHNEYDDIPFVDQFADEGIVSNADMYAFLDPWNDDLPYVYDTLDFDYCVEDGYTFD